MIGSGGLADPAVSGGRIPILEPSLEAVDLGARQADRVATLIGGTSGFLGGKLDLAVQRFVDAWMAFPGLLLLTIMSVAGQGLPQIIVVLGIAGGVGGSRVVRGAVVATKGNDFFLAARAVGSPTRQVLVRHVPEPGVHRQWGPPARRP